MRAPPFRSSAKQSALLRYLVAQSLAERTPHETDIAVEVFGKDDSYNPAESSSVRVSVHQLRRKLEQYYEENGQNSHIRLSIPKGSYRVCFGAPYFQSSLSPPGSNVTVSKTSKKRWMGALAVLAISISANGFFLLQHLQTASINTAPTHPGEDLVWQDLGEAPGPILIALGDVFFYTEIDKTTGERRYIRDIGIESSEDLRRLSNGSSISASELTYLPKATAFALEAILPFVRATGKDFSLKLMSEVTGDDLRQTNVIYIGLVRSMGALHEYFFRSSNFSPGPSFLALERKRTGETFSWSGELFGETKDYGLFSNIAGPSGMRIAVFTGISGIGMLAAVRAITDPVRAQEVKRQVRTNVTGVSSGIEVLFEVSGYDRIDLASQITVASSVSTE